MIDRSIRFAAAAIALVLAAACNDASGPVDPTELAFAPSLNVELAAMTRTSTGLYYRDEVVGTGRTVQAGDDVAVRYTGWLHTGQMFDTNQNGAPFTVRNVGQANVIAGWNQGLIGMREGGRRLLVIPSQLAYGANPPGSIPVHATLVFRVDALTVTR